MNLNIGNLEAAHLFSGAKDIAGPRTKSIMLHGELQWNNLKPFKDGTKASAGHHSYGETGNCLTLEILKSKWPSHQKLRRIPVGGI